MDAATAHPFSGPVLAPDRLVLTPAADAAPSAAGTVRSFHAGPAGLAVRLTAEVAGLTAEQFDGQRVWVTANTQGKLIAFQAVAHRVAETSLETNGITAPVEEHRRAQMRARTRVPVRLDVDDGPDAPPLVAEGHTVDLSRGGCRIEVSADAGLGPDHVAAPVEISLRLTGVPMTAGGEILRIDPNGSEVSVRFTRLTTDDAVRIERHVLSLLV